MPAAIWPLAEHAEFGQNCFDASIGSGVLFCISTSCRGASLFSILLLYFTGWWGCTLRARHHAKRILRNDFLQLTASRTEEEKQQSWECMHHATARGTLPFLAVHDYHIGISQQEVNESALALERIGVFEVKRDRDGKVIYSSTCAIYTRPTLKYFTDPSTWYENV